MDTITFYKPNKTLPLSLTGAQCELNCSHCGSQYLKHMHDISTINLPNNHTSYKSLLISGGSDKHGRLRLEDKISHLESYIKDSLNLNIHTGLATSKTIKSLENLIALATPMQKISISFDFLTHNQTIKDVYNIPKKRDDYINALLNLKQLETKAKDSSNPLVTVIPHICIGLWEGKVAGEFDALDCLYDMGFKNLVFIVFKPTAKTKLEEKLPPSITDVKKVFTKGINLFGSENIQLGCMRPAGVYRDTLDNMAIELGIRHIVMPSKLAITKAKSMNLEINYKNECCVF